MDIEQLALRVDSLEVLTADNRMNSLNRTASVSPGLMKAFASAVASIGLISLAKDALDTYSAFETMNASLKTVTGSYASAAVVMKVVEGFASTTPYSLEQATQGFIKLKSLGLDPSSDAMRSYGNTAAAMGKDLNQMIEAVADATTGEFERLKEFGIRSKTVGDDVQFTFQGVTTTVKKNASEIEGYLRSIGDVNFGGAMADQMDTIKGATSNFSDNFAKLQRDFIEATGLGDAYKETLKDISQEISEIDFEVIASQLRTWRDFADDVKDAYEELEEFGRSVSDVIGLFEESELTIKDFFLDLPVYAEASYNMIMAHAVYALDYIQIKYDKLKLTLENIWVQIASAFMSNFNEIRVFAAEVGEDVLNFYADILQKSASLARAVGKDDLSKNLILESFKIRSEGYQEVVKAQKKASESEKDFAKQITSNKANIKGYDDALKAASATRRESIRIATQSVYIAKEEREAEVQLALTKKEHEKITDELISLETDLGKGRDKVTASTNKNKIASKELKKAIDELKSSQQSLGLGYANEIASLDRREKALTANKDELLAYDLAQKTFGKNQLKFSQDQIKEIVNRNKNIVSLEKAKEADKKAQEVRKKALKTLKDYFAEQERGYPIIEGLTELESKNAKVQKDRIEKLKQISELYEKEKQSILDRNRALTLTPLDAYKENLKDQGLSPEKVDELANGHAANDAREQFGLLDKENLRYEQELEILRTAEQMKLDTVRPYHELRETLELEHQNKLSTIAQQAAAQRYQAEIQAFRLATKPYQDFTGGVLDILKASGQEQSGVYKAMFEASKAFAIAESIIKIQQGIAQASSLPFPANLGAIGSVISTTAGIVSTIRGTEYAGAFAHGGDFMIGGKGGTDNNRIAMDVSRGEQVIIRTPQQQKQVSSGGKPVINLTVINNADKEEVKQSESSDGSSNIEVFVKSVVDRTKAEITKEFVLGGEMKEAAKIAVS